MAQPADQPFRLDLHVHSRHSRDAQGSLLELAHAAKAAGLQGFAITDHNTRAGHAEAIRAAQKTGMMIVPGIEVSSIEGHVLAIGVSGDVPAKHSLRETVESTRDVGGVAIPSHPLRLLSGVGPSTLRQRVEEGLIAVVESHNARERRPVQENLAAFCGELGVTTVGGSDTHTVREIGTAYTEFDDMPASLDDVLDAIERGRCRGIGGSSPRRHVWRHSASVPWRLWKSRR